MKVITALNHVENMVKQIADVIASAKSDDNIGGILCWGEPLARCNKLHRLLEEADSESGAGSEVDENLKHVLLEVLEDTRFGMAMDWETEGADYTLLVEGLRAA